MRRPPQPHAGREWHRLRGPRHRRTVGGLRHHAAGLARGLRRDARLPRRDPGHPDRAPDRRWRVYLRPSSPDSDLVVDAAATLHRYYPTVSLTDVENPTRFHCHTMVAAEFRAGPVLLAGDAAHLCSPAQGHGMNTGLQDAFNLAWKLALVHHGVADPALLDSYEVERRPVAALVGEAGDEFEGEQTLTDPGERDRRNQALRGMFAETASRHHEAVAHAELSLDCSGSPIVVGDANASLAPGQRLPDTIPVATETGPGRLHELTRHAGHTLVLLGGPAAEKGRAPRTLRRPAGVYRLAPVRGGHRLRRPRPLRRDRTPRTGIGHAPRRRGHHPARGAPRRVRRPSGRPRSPRCTRGLPDAPRRAPLSAARRRGQEPASARARASRSALRMRYPSRSGSTARSRLSSQKLSERVSPTT